ncbi:MAG TPA: hypothetical protein VFB58_05660 [Chloroflexota bacterium]|nr:hypothetical protein [Chloroflexota bacterium]
MSDDQTSQGSDLWKSYVSGKVTRAQLLAAVASGAAALAVPGAAGAAGGPRTLSFPFYPAVQGTYTPESIQDILNNIVTPAYYAISGITIILSQPSQFGLSGLALTITQAIAAQEQYHIDFWTSKGAVPVTTSFTAPASVLTPAGAAATSEISATIQTANFMTAAREFAELGQPELAKWAYQTGAQEAGQRVAYRFLEALGGATGVLPNNKAFETDLFLYTRDAINAYRLLGLIGGNGTPYSYPGRDAVLAAAGPMASAVLQQVPNNATSSVTITGPTSLTGERS